MLNLIVASFLAFLTLITSVIASPLSAQTLPTPVPETSPLPTPSPNEDAFHTKLTTTYTVDQASITRVKHEFAITNRTPTTFIKQYAMTTAYPNLSNVVVTERGQNIKANVVTTDNQTSIAITFPTDLVGEGKTRSFTIEYTNPDLASIGGSVLEVHAPELSDPEQYDENIVRLITPITFGNPVRSNPEESSSTISENGILTTYTDLRGRPLSVLFGSEQFYSLNLKYNLENQSSSEAFTQIALPPDTNFQQLNYEALDPRPEEIKRDADGNWIAKYHLPANSITTVQLKATAKLTLEPNESRNMPSPGKAHQKTDKFWNFKSSQVAAQADLNRTPEEIFAFVVDTLTYNPNIEGIPTRLGAEKALELPETAVCQEYTDLFVSLARANGIPARRLTGFAYTQNEELRPIGLEGDILHAWPEYFDFNKNLWVQVDPTWADTTGGVDYFHQFDLNHIVFAINGESSITPYPAGSYKAQGSNSEDVEVVFADNFPAGQPEITTVLEPIRVLGLPLPGFYNLKITNQSGQAWYDIIAHFTHDGSQAKINNGQDLAIDALLPFQAQTFTITAHTPSWQIIKGHPVTVNLSLNGMEPNYESQTKEITAGPAFIGYFKNPQVIIGLGVGLTLLALIGGSILVFRRT